MKKGKTGLLLAGIGAGAVNGLLGAGGGMVLIPLLGAITDLNEQEHFPASVSIIAPICIISVLFSGISAAFTWGEAIPYLLGSAAGGLIAGFLSPKIPVIWLHRILGIFILWGGFRYLC